MHLASQTTGGTERTIQIESPAAGTQVGDTVEVKGSVSIVPFENTLGYRLYHAANNQLAEGTFVTANITGTSGTFDATVEYPGYLQGLRSV